MEHKHDLRRILSTDEDACGAQHVVRWCSICGAVVVDIDCDGRVSAGAHMKMQLPDSARAEREVPMTEPTNAAIPTATEIQVLRWFQESTIRHHIDSDGEHIKLRAKYIADQAIAFGYQAAQSELTALRAEVERLKAEKLYNCVVYDLSPTAVESAIHNKLIKLGWTPPQEQSEQPDDDDPICPGCLSRGCNGECMISDMDFNN